MKIVKSLEETDLLIKGVNKTIKNGAKAQTEEFLSMLLNTLGASLLRNLLNVKGTIRAGEGNLKYTNIIKTNLNLMVFIPEIICLK